MLSLDGLAPAVCLRELVLTGNGLRSASSLPRLPRLAWLDVSRNALARLPPLPFLTPLLEELLAGGNKLDAPGSDLHPADGVPPLQRLASLSIPGNPTGSLLQVSKLGALPALTQLVLRDSEHGPCSLCALPGATAAAAAGIPRLCRLDGRAVSADEGATARRLQAEAALPLSVRAAAAAAAAEPLRAAASAAAAAAASAAAAEARSLALSRAELAVYAEQRLLPGPELAAVGKKLSCLSASLTACVGAAAAHRAALGAADAASESASEIDAAAAAAEEASWGNFRLVEPVARGGGGGSREHSIGRDGSCSRSLRPRGAASLSIDGLPGVIASRLFVIQNRHLGAVFEASAAKVRAALEAARSARAAADLADARRAAAAASRAAAAERAAADAAADAAAAAAERERRAAAPGGGGSGAAGLLPGPPFATAVPKPGSRGAAGAAAAAGEAGCGGGDGSGDAFASHAAAADGGDGDGAESLDDELASPRRRVWSHRPAASDEDGPDVYDEETETEEEETEEEEEEDGGAAGGAAASAGWGGGGGGAARWQRASAARRRSGSIPRGAAAAAAAAAASDTSGCDGSSSDGGGDDCSDDGDGDGNDGADASSGDDGAPPPLPGVAAVSFPSRREASHALAGLAAQPLRALIADPVFLFAPFATAAAAVAAAEAGLTRGAAAAGELRLFASPPLAVPVGLPSGGGAGSRPPAPAPFHILYRLVPGVLGDDCELGYQPSGGAGAGLPSEEEERGDGSAAEPPLPSHLVPRTPGLLLPELLLATEAAPVTHAHTCDAGAEQLDASVASLLAPTPPPLRPSLRPYAKLLASLRQYAPFDSRSVEAARLLEPRFLPPLPAHGLASPACPAGVLERCAPGARLAVLTRLELACAGLGASGGFLPLSLPSSTPLLVSLSAPFNHLVAIDGLKGLAKLEALRVGDNDLSKVDSASLAGLPSLRSLDLSRNPLARAEEVAHVAAGAPRVSELWLAGCSALEADAGGAHLLRLLILRRCRSLTSLDGAGVPPAAGAAAARTSSQVTLGAALRGASCRGGARVPLAAAPSASSSSDAAVATADDPAQALAVHCAALSLKCGGLRKLAGLPYLPNCVRLDVSRNALRRLDELPAAVPCLAELLASHNALASLAPLSHLPCLTSLRCPHNPGIGSPSLLASLGPSVARLDLQRCGVSSLAPFASLPVLRALYLSFNDVPHAKEAPMLGRHLRSLVALCLQGNPVASLPLHRARFAQALPQLRFLDGSPVANADAEAGRDAFAGLITAENVEDAVAAARMAAEQAAAPPPPPPPHADDQGGHPHRGSSAVCHGGGAGAAAFALRPAARRRAAAQLDLRDMQLRSLGGRAGALGREAEGATRAWLRTCRSALLDGNGALTSLSPLHRLPRLEHVSAIGCALSAGLWGGGAEEAAEEAEAAAAAAAAAAASAAAANGGPLPPHPLAAAAPPSAASPLPPLLPFCPSLEKLDIARNSIAHLAPIQLSRLAALRFLGLAGNALGPGVAAIPSALPPLPLLGTLVLDANDIRSLPSNFLAPVPSLRALSLADNKLRTLGFLRPPHRRLRALNLARNRLGAAAESTADLRALGDTVSLFLSPLPLLRDLRLEGNPCADPSEAAAAGPAGYAFAVARALPDLSTLDGCAVARGGDGGWGAPPGRASIYFAVTGVFFTPEKRTPLFCTVPLTRRAHRRVGPAAAAAQPAARRRRGRRLGRRHAAESVPRTSERRGAAFTAPRSRETQHTRRRRRRRRRSVQAAAAARPHVFAVFRVIIWAVSAAPRARAPARLGVAPQPRRRRRGCVAGRAAAAAVGTPRLLRRRVVRRLRRRICHPPRQLVLVLRPIHVAGAARGGRGGGRARAVRDRRVAGATPTAQCAAPHRPSVGAAARAHARGWISPAVRRRRRGCALPARRRIRRRRIRRRRIRRRRRRRRGRRRRGCSCRVVSRWREGRRCEPVSRVVAAAPPRTARRGRLPLDSLPSLRLAAAGGLRAARLRARKLSRGCAAASTAPRRPASSLLLLHTRRA